MGVQVPLGHQPFAHAAMTPVPQLTPIEARLTPTPLSTAIRKSGWVALFLRAGGHQIWLFREFCVLVTLGAS